MNNSQITSRIKLLCKEKNISVAQLLSNCGFAKSFVYDLEKRDNSPSCDRISKIADVLECSVDYLLGRTDTPKPEVEVVKRNDNHGLNTGINTVEFTVPVTVAHETHLDENQQELLTRFSHLKYKDKLAFMQELVEKTEEE